MSQSELHRNLVVRVTEALEVRYPEISIVTDLQNRPGDPIPPLIGGYRPDVYGTKTIPELEVIADAKTDRDVDRKHTHDQLEAFVDYLEGSLRGVVVLAVTGCTADLAKTVLWFTHRRAGPLRTNFEVFDGCDFWTLDSKGNVRWRLG